MLDATLEPANAHNKNKFTSDPQEEAQRQARYFEYSSAANPIRPGLTPRVPFHLFASSLYDSGSTRRVVLDLSEQLHSQGPATGPGLCASFLRILAGEALTLDDNATSQVFYAISGAGAVQSGGVRFQWMKGDFFTAPGGSPTIISASEDATLYSVNDAPLLTYLGVRTDRPRFAPTLYPAARANAELLRVRNDPNASNRSRISVLLGHENFPRTRTVTHVLWAMYGVVPRASAQKPHRHQSIALDFIVDCAPGCYSLVGAKLDDGVAIADPVRVDWEPGCAFVTPPGYWHAHFNESGADARLIPIQDAGLQTYLRTLDIRFT